MAERRGLLCFGGFCRHDWSLLWQRQQAVMTRLAAHFEIYYVERFSTRPLSWTEIVSAAWKRMAGRRRGPLRAELQGVRFVNPGVVPFHGSRRWRRRNVAALGRAVRNAWPADLRRSVLWIYNPSYPALEFLKQAHGRWERTVYDCVQRFEYNRHYPPDIGEIDREIARRVDLVFADSRTIAEEKRPLNAATHFIPPGVDIERFLWAGVNRTPPDELRWLRRPIFGYHGAWHQAFDADLVGAVLENVENSTFAFVGPTFGREAGFRRRYPQAVFLGPKDHVRLGRYVNAFDVCLIPYRRDAHTEGVFPTKFFEYVATGLPIVSTDLPDLREYHDWVHLAGDRDSFVENARRAVAAQRRAVKVVRPFVEQHAWDRRVETMLGLLGLDQAPRGGKDAARRPLDA